MVKLIAKGNIKYIFPQQRREIESYISQLATHTHTNLNFMPVASASTLFGSVLLDLVQV